MTRIYAPRRRISAAAVHLFLIALLATVMSAGLMAAHPSAAVASVGSDTLNSNETLRTGESLFSQNRAYELRLQTDGNLVVYGPQGPIWSSNTVNSGATRLVMQSDGNLVMYTAGGSVPFATGARGAGARLVMQNDGNLVEYAGPAVWASKNRSEAAIQWFFDHRGKTNYEGFCERAVENAFGTAHVYASAIANWRARSQQQPYTAAPRGSLVFYNTSSNGHVAVSLGNGTVISTSARGQIGSVNIGYFQRPLGWAWAPWS